MPTKLLNCKCKYPYQDKKYGQNVRVMNQTTTKSPSTQGYRCTVCGTEHIINTGKQ